MRTIVIDVQLAPSTAGVDIFKESEELHKEPNQSYYRNGNGDAHPVGIFYSQFPELKQITKPVLAQIVIKLPREAGNYWVKYKGKWKVAQWSPNNWYLAGNGLSFSDSEFDEIDETIIERTT